MCRQKNEEEILEFICGLSVLELSELIAEFESKFDVKANPIIQTGQKVKVKKNLKKGTFEKKFFRGC